MPRMPVEFSLYDRPQKTLTVSQPMPLIEMTIHSNTDSTVSGSTLAIDGLDSTSAELTTNGDDLWIDLGDYYKITTVMIVVDHGTGAGHNLAVDLFRYSDTAFTGDQPLNLLAAAARTGQTVHMLQPASGVNQTFWRYVRLNRSDAGAAPHLRIFHVFVSTL